VKSLSGISVIAAGGEQHSLALKENSTVWAWGDNDFGQLGNGTYDGGHVPVQVSIGGIKAIAGGGCHSLAVRQ
jgi:alpha-tubulin suppressor-like RCC1 family protein